MATPATEPTEAGPLLNISTFDLLLIELVPLAERMAQEYDSSLDRPSPSPAKTKPSSTSAQPTNPSSLASTSPATQAPDTPSQLVQDAIYNRLESLGYRVGWGLAERFSRDRPRFSDSLDAIKFLCKDLWIVVFRKQVDNLKTNHRGVFVLTDARFRPFARMSTTSHTDALRKAQPHLFFPCGLIRGALAALGIKAIVQAESTELPGAVFQIKTLTGK